jgi:hypothetical protein
VWHDRAGATALGSGALDLTPWEHTTGAEPLDTELFAFATALGAWSLHAESAMVATPAGVVRPARGIDGALLDLALLRGRTVGVPETPLLAWDGPSIVRALSASPWAQRTRTRFVAHRVDLLQNDSEKRRTSYDFALLHDDPKRAAYMAERLRAAKVSCDAWLLGPWLGVAPGAAEIVRERVGMPCGETTSEPGDAAGARFDAARDELLASVGARVERRRVMALDARQNGVALQIEKRDGSAEEQLFDRVILAIGGVVGGGVVLEDPALTRHSGGSFGLSLDAPVLLSLDGRTLDRVSSLHGVDIQARGIGVLERVGIATREGVVVELASVFAAGDVVADRPRTVLEAVRAGINAARAAVASR